MGLEFVDDIEREYFREFKSSSERGIVPAPADFFELVRTSWFVCPYSGRVFLSQKVADSLLRVSQTAAAGPGS